MRSLRLRVVAAILALGFVGGMGGVSDLDALLFHRSVAASAGASHVETANGGGCHAERCVLALRLANGRGAPPLGLAIRFEGMPLHGAGAVSIPAPRRITPGSRNQSRAPPASIA